MIGNGAQGNRMADVLRRLNELERAVARPDRFVVPRTMIAKYLLIGGGNDVLTNADGTWTGIKFQNALTTFTVPAATPTPGTTYADGLGYGTLYDEAGSSLGTVWIIDAASINGISFSTINQTLFTNGWYLSIASVQVEIYGSSPTAYATCYVPWRS